MWIIVTLRIVFYRNISCSCHIQINSAVAQRFTRLTSQKSPGGNWVGELQTWVARLHALQRILFKNIFFHFIEILTRELFDCVTNED